MDINRITHEIIGAAIEVHSAFGPGKAQLLCYMRLSGCKLGLLLNFNELRLVDGITRMILD